MVFILKPRKGAYEVRVDRLIGRLQVGAPPPAPPHGDLRIVSPRLDLGPTAVTGTITVVGPPGSDALEYTVTTNQPWLTVTPTRFVLNAGDTQSITVSVDRTGLAAGPQTGHVTIAPRTLMSVSLGMANIEAVPGNSVVSVNMNVSAAGPKSEPGEGANSIWILVLMGLNQSQGGNYILQRWQRGGSFHHQCVGSGL